MNHQPDTARDRLIAYAAATRTVTADGLGPFLDAFAEEVRVAASSAGPEPSDPTQCSGEEGFCPEHGFHRHSLKQPGEPEADPDQTAPDAALREVLSGFRAVDNAGLADAGEVLGFVGPTVAPQDYYRWCDVSVASQAAPDQAGLRDRIAEALARFGDVDQHAMADVVVAVLPASVDRADVLREEAALIRAHCPDHLDADSAEGSWMVCHCDVADDMERRAAAETHNTTGRDLPRRGDRFEAWLKTQRDAAADYPEAYQAADGLLDLYRLHADTGTPLTEHVCEARAVGDCDCLETPPAGGAPQPKEADTDRVVAYRSALPGALSIYCTGHTDELGDGVLPLTSDDLPDGGLCVSCGVDVLIPQQPKEA